MRDTRNNSRGSATRSKSVPPSRSPDETYFVRQKDLKRGSEVDAYENPTELFKWINFGDWARATQRTVNHPVEASTWIVSRYRVANEHGSGPGHRDRGGEIKWRYLPLHLVCLQSNPPRSLIRALTEAYPKGVRSRDHAGNLPLHYICSEGCEDGEVLELLLDAYPESLCKKDALGRTPTQIIQNRGTPEGRSLRSLDKILAKIHSAEERRDARSISQSKKRRDPGREERDQADPTPIPILDQNIHSSHRRNRKDEKNASAGDAAEKGPAVDRTERHGKKSKKHREKKQTSSDHLHRKHGNEKTAQRQSDSLLKSGKKDNAELLDMIQELERKLDDSVTERDVLRHNVAELARTEASQKNTIDDLTKNLSSASAASVADREENRKFRLRVAELESNMAESDAKCKSFESKVEQLVQENEEWKVKLSRQETEFEGKLHSVREAVTKQAAAFAECAVGADFTPDSLLPNNRSLGAIISDEGSLIVPDSEEESEWNSKLRKEVEKVKNDSRLVEKHLRDKISDLELELSAVVDAAKQAARTRPERAQLEEKDSLISELREKIDKVNSDSAVVEKHLRSQIKSLESDLSAAVDAVAQDAKAKAESAQSDELKVTISELREEMDRVKSDSTIVEKHLRSKMKDMESELSAAVHAAEQAAKTRTNREDMISELREEIDKVKSGSAIVEGHLRSKINDLELELSRAIDAAERAAKNRTNRAERQRQDADNENNGVEEMTSTDKNSLRLMNESLQNQIAATKENCNTLERKLKDTTNERDALRAKIASFSLPHEGKESSTPSKTAEISQRQRELQKEFDTIWSCVKEMSKDGAAFQGNVSELSESETFKDVFSKSVHEVTSANAAYQKKIKELRDIISKNNVSYQARVGQLMKKQDGLQGENKVLKEELDKLKEEAIRLGEVVKQTNSDVSGQGTPFTRFSQKGRGEKQDSLPGMSENAPEYDAHVKELTAKHETLTSKNKALRDIITKNNQTYLAKVEELSEAYEKLKQDNDVQMERIQELTLKNNTYQKHFERMMVSHETDQTPSILEQPSSIELTQRVNTVAAFLVSISDMQHRIVQSATKLEQKMQTRTAADREKLVQTITKQESELDVASKKRERLMRAIMKQEEDLVLEASGERERILKISEQHERDAMAAAAEERELIAKAISKQRRELEAIAADLASLQPSGSQEESP